ncbi:thermonuclease family protein [Sandaracinobacter sp.]|uniref:thermonuclease family protein n=1 Tax=Sandaracinobacter sp. TaxID=2487581 RepID=UPI0035B15641
MPARLALLLLFVAVPAGATVFSGTVTRVKDGDSILVHRPDVKRTSEVRLAGIDAPELAQPWGIQSRTALRRMVQDRSVRVEVTDRDAYGRLVGRVWQGRTHVNAALAAGGNAWAFDRYLKDREIRAGQNRARRERRGLWALPPEQRLPPPTWRDRHPTGGR